MQVVTLHAGDPEPVQRFDPTRFTWRDWQRDPDPPSVYVRLTDDGTPYALAWTPRVWNVGTELLQRFLADTCELCGSQIAVQVHHIRALKDLQPQRPDPKPEWVKVMAARQRKTLVVCRTCHDAIEQGCGRRHARLCAKGTPPNDSGNGHWRAGSIER